MNTASGSSPQSPRIASEASTQQQRSEIESALDHPVDDTRCNGMSIQRLTLDNAVAPLLPRPIAPFDRTERKRAYTSAVYYSECFLRGIEPLVADTAAVEVEGQYNKWWIQRTASKDQAKAAASRTHGVKNVQKRHRNEDSDDHDHDVKRKYVRTSPGDDNATAASADHMSVSSGPNVVSDASSYLGSFQEHVPRHSEEVPRPPPMEQISTLSMANKTNIETVRNQLIEDLRQSGGQIDTPEVVRCMEILQTYYSSGGLQKVDPSSLRGNWLTISKPTYTECQGKSKTGESMYTLGRIGFDMFKPSGLLCSVQASFNNVQPINPKNPGRPLHVPKKLMRDIQKGECQLHSYDIVVAITVEPGQDRKGQIQEDSTAASDNDYIVPRPIRGILTTQGYSIPDPVLPERLSIWFSGGTLEVQDEDDLEEWKQIFDVASAPDRFPKEYANMLAAKVLLGAHLPDNLEEDGTMSFSLKRPIGGHGSVYCDVLFMDEQLRIMKGHHGSVYVCIRVPEVPS